MVRSLVLVSLLLNVALAAQVSQAQLFRGNTAPPAAREPARVGLLGGIREALEERFRREEQAAAAARKAATRAATTQAPAETGNAASKTANAASVDALRRNATASSSSTNPAQKATANTRTANFRGPSGAAANRGQENAGQANSKINTDNSLSRATLPNPATNVTQASASAFVPAPLDGQQYDGQQYRGTGVVIRLPKEAPSPVNFLIDETSTSTIRPGEEQALDAKGNYVVRYSRGVTRNGRSFGETRYKISEGRYRFELTATGWELYREPDSENTLAPPNPVDLVDNPANASESAELLSPEPSLQPELQRIPANLPAGKLDSILTQPSSGAVNGAQAGNEEVLPAPKPRSILE